MTDEQTKAFIERLDQFAKANNLTVNGLTAAIGKSNSYFRNTYQSGGYIRREIWDTIREKIDEDSRRVIDYILEKGEFSK